MNIQGRWVGSYMCNNLVFTSQVPHPPYFQVSRGTRLVHVRLVVSCVDHWNFQVNQVWFPDPLGKCQNQTRWCIEHLAVGQNGSSGMPGGITFIGDIYILFGCSSYKLASHNGLL